MRSYRLTAKACYLSYVVQALVINLPPLLFSTFSRLYGLGIKEMGFLILLVFSVQILIELLSAPLARCFGYRKSVRFGHASVVAGLIVMVVFPGFQGLVCSLILQGLGSGVVEVLISPIIQYLPVKGDKDHAMSFLHSFYCWGMALVIALSSLLFHVVGEARWFLLPLCWIPLPLCAFFLFLFCPIAPIPGDGKKRGLGLLGLCRKPVFWVLLVMMPLGSSSELAVSQWVSYYAELGLGVSKLAGDLLGPCMFACLQGLSRLWYSRENGISVEKLMISCSLLCVAGYCFVARGGSALLSLVGCGMVGFAVGSFWPGTFSLAARHLSGGGTLLYSLLAFAGDVGCGAGPQVVSWANSVGEGLMHAMLFPALLGLCLVILHRMEVRNG